MPVYAENKKARLAYEVIEQLDAGIELLGLEVKAIRAKKASLVGAHISVRGSEAYLLGAHIAPYQSANTPKEYDPERARKLLLTKKEIAKLVGFEKQKGLTIVPLSIYNKGRNLKLSLAVARGKKKKDKRQSIKKKDTERDLRRSLKTKMHL